VRPTYRPGLRDAQSLATICARLDALPLALELAAAWLRLLTPQEALDRLQGGTLPSLSHRDTPERHRSMAAAVQWSYDLIGEEDRRFFRRLAILPGGCSVALAAAVAIERAGGSDAEQRALGPLARLVEHSLLLREEAVGGGVRYRMLETVRAYAAERLAASGERPRAVEGLVSYCVDLAAGASSALFGPDQVSWLDRLGAELANIRAALSHLEPAGGKEDAARILGGTGYFWMIRGHVTEGLEWCDRVLAIPGPLPDGVQARLLIAAGMMAMPRQLTERAAGYLDRAIALAESAGDDEALALGLNQRAFASLSGEDVPGATVRFERSLALFRERATRWGKGANLIGLAHARLLTGDFDEAERLLLEAQPLLHAAGSWWSYGITFSYLAQLALLRGRPDETIALALEAATRLEPLQDSFDLTFTLVYMACACVDKQADLTAARLFGALDALMNATGLGMLDPATRELRSRYEARLEERGDPRRLERARAAGRETPIARLRRDLGRLVGGGGAGWS
jgi:tetratricopeptide (TPR) repeat protein